ncbi:MULTISPECIES: D-alanyl-D-alanine carboxypeptidase DacA [Enterobacteriaceae]|jgi:D-alanyl-D-alanine carboxypeptidase (penicillin-binding protein 5/6)|uniref:serine-type D-Ala-D-Ala carboxypeptidase n=2 Tax=Enterobacteriaceae TaxID=543 RepID=A0ABW1Q258_9ENTR|nr:MULTISPECIES: D-alanyl-D-alanine carboxypeptidase DacA [Enterobacteriaceae]AUU89920.1 serine-type D-Ala-D-Ala carboxypeptidase [Enterobacteriaceae bacterium ENNIH3]AUV09995.1 serine-type D-Ala-D-Ala carboxypeptidase [Enterobacteriaceae bacterium ENNIH2]MBS6737203.1 D-alanyl-D-alanine carboxypeptidase DacA [Enterobacteriaceae bacterium]PWF51570.1 serine-type D-Ala-D-Ala carboxypeptidase [[Kluyvera] intestini]PXW54324.1 penicillin-binding protein 6 [Grimontella sp. AG753]QIH64604.1 serine-ty
MKTTLSVRFVQRLALTTALTAATLGAAHADDLNIKTMIPGAPQIDAESWILIDYNSGKVLTEQNADSRRDPASLTKMMTSYVIGQAMKAGKFKDSDLVTIGNDAWATGNPVFRGSSLMFLKPGMQVPVSQLIRGINLQSGNDACVAMADYVAGSQDAFVGLMNNYVKALGLQNSHFQTVHGLDAEGQYSSARDMALIGQALIRDVPNEYSIYKEKEFTFNGIRQTNRNGLLWDNSLNVDGIKTGHTDKAGYNLVASATEGQMRLISAVMGGRTFKGREAESKKLLTWGFRFFETVSPLKAGKEFASEPAWFGDNDRASLGVDKDVYLTIPRGRMKDLKASYVLSTSELHAPLQKNQVVGTINFQLDGKTIEQRPLVVLQEIQEGNFFGKIIDYIKLMFHHWFG